MAKKLVLLSEFRTQRKPGAETRKQPSHIELTMAGLHINPKNLTPKQYWIIMEMIKSFPRIAQEVERITGVDVALDDIRLCLKWYHWGLIRNFRRIDDLITPEDCVKRFRNFIIRKLDSLANLKAKQADIQSKTVSV